MQMAGRRRAPPQDEPSGQGAFWRLTRSLSLSLSLTLALPGPNPIRSASPNRSPNLSPKQPQPEGGEIINGCNAPNAGNNGHGGRDDGRDGHEGSDGHNAHGEPCWLAEAWSEVGIAGREAERQEQDKWRYREI